MVDTTKEKRLTIEVCQDLIDILDKIKEKVDEYTWGAEPKLSNFKVSKILANRIGQAGWYN